MHSVNVDDEGIWSSNLCTDCCWEAEAHCSQTPRGNHRTWITPPKVLINKHLGANGGTVPAESAAKPYEYYY